MHQRLILTLSPAEQAALTKLAEADVRSPREQLRYILRSEAERRHVWQDDPASADLGDYLIGSTSDAVHRSRRP